VSTGYEVLLMLDPELAEERSNEILQRIRELVEKGGGTWDGHEPWGRRRLAYEIDHKAEGVYHLLLFTSDAETLDELSRILRITDGVIRHMAVRRTTRRTTPIRPGGGEHRADDRGDRGDRDRGDRGDHRERDHRDRADEARERS
jgi:small subunit ribosomal protein S6